MATSVQRALRRRVTGQNVWLESPADKTLTPGVNEGFKFDVLDSEAAVAAAMLQELMDYSDRKGGDINIVLLGGRGAQAMYRKIRVLAETTEIDDLLGRLNVFTQDALAPMQMGNSLSFVRDFERLLGDNFFSKVKSFTSML